MLQCVSPDNALFFSITMVLPHQNAVKRLSTTPTDGSVSSRIAPDALGCQCGLANHAGTGLGRWRRRGRRQDGRWRRRGRRQDRRVSALAERVQDTPSPAAQFVDHLPLHLLRLLPVSCGPCEERSIPTKERITSRTVSHGVQSQSGECSPSSHSRASRAESV